MKNRSSFWQNVKFWLEAWSQTAAGVMPTNYMFFVRETLSYVFIGIGCVWYGVSGTHVGIDRNQQVWKTHLVKKQKASNN